MDIILCVTGSVAAIEAVKLARAFKREGVNVKCFMSDAACNIIHPNSMEFATGEDVVLDISGKIEHVKYSQTDLVLVAPATANVISKFAYKIADNLINTLLVTAHGHDTPIVFVPSMHDSMFKSIKDNVEKIKNEGIIIIPPKMEEGKAKFPNLEDIILESIRMINLNSFDDDGNCLADLKGKKIIVSAGGTYEPIDPIRGITNRSSGKMGIEVAKEAYRRGGDVTLLAARVDVPIPNCIKTIRTYTSENMSDECAKLVKDSDILVAAAAVSDFIPVSMNETKIKSCFKLNLELKPTDKIIRKMKKLNPDIFLIGFKAEYDIPKEELINSAKKQISDTCTNLVVANDVSLPGAGFTHDTNKVILVDDEIQELPLTSKTNVSSIILNNAIKKMK